MCGAGCEIIIIIIIIIIIVNNNNFKKVCMNQEIEIKRLEALDLPGFIPWELPVVKIFPEWVTGPEQVSPVVGLLPLASGLACLGMAFPPFLVKQLYRCDSVVISSFVRTEYTTRRWGWLLGRIGYSITHHYPIYPLYLKKSNETS